MNNDEWIKATKKKYIDEANKSMDALIKAECWLFINNFLEDLSMRAWRMDIDYLLAYATATLSIKDKLSNRERFILTCKHLYPKTDWKGLI